MAHNTSLDSIQIDRLDLPYNKIEAELSSKLRIVRGSNAYVTLGGKLCKRPGTILLPDTNITGKRIDRLWIYESLETPPKVFIVASMYDIATAVWQMYYIRLSAASPAWTQFDSLRSINESTRPHEAVSSRGLLYVKGYPSAASGEKLGTIIMDGSGTAPVFQYWGILPPVAPAALYGEVTTLNGTLNVSSGSLTVNSDPGFPVAPFTIQVEDEQMLVTAVVGLNWTVNRGINDTTPSSHPDLSLVLWRAWDPSDHQVDVAIGWGYTYAYKTSTGQVSNRAPLETNPDKSPSRTGPFQDLIPKFILEGVADTTNVPTIVVFRSTDGGGTYFQLEEIDNPGAGIILYTDDSFESGTSGGVFNDPVPDSTLDTGTRATTLTSNSPPPTVIDPQVVGTDTPVASTPIASYAARLWIGIGNILFYSGQEEITLGIPEESWPSGTFGNFFRFQYPIINIAATSSALYVFTLQTSYELTGTNRETFNVKPIFESIGAPYGHPRAVTRYEDTIILLTHDFRICRIQDSQAEVISDPLYTDIIDGMNAGLEYDIKFWADLEKEWIVVSGYDNNIVANTRQWVFDLKKSKILQDPFWFPPWTMKISAMASGRVDEASGQRRLVLAMYNRDDGSSTCLTRIDPTGRTGSDYYITGAIGFAFDVITNLFLVPPGDHVNKLRVPGITPVLYGVSLDRTLFPGDTDPLVYYYKDDFWTNPLQSLYSEDPPRRDLSRAYKTLLFTIQEVVQHCAFEVVKLSSVELFEMQNLQVLFLPDAGA